MGTTYSWHPRIAVVNPRWPKAQSLLADELLSSWLIRNAFAHGCSPMSLTGSIWPGWRCWTLDLDRGVPDRKLLPLSIMTGIAVSDIYSSTIRPIAQVLNPALDHHKGMWPWILGLGTRNRRHSGGLQCCPLCLAEGVPYYRLSSRLVWHTCCEKHQMRLIDRCPECGAPLEPHLLEQVDSDCGHCHRCRTPFSSHSDFLGFAAGALAFQRAADGAMHGLASGEDTNCDPGEWFYRARFIISILRVAAVNGSKPFAAFLEAFHLGVVERPDSGLPIELLSVGDRMDLLSATWKVMDMGEHQLNDAIAACLLPQHSVPIPAGEIPVSLQATLEALPVGKPRKRTAIGFRSPASQHTVAKLWARLKRKVQRDD